MFVIEKLRGSISIFLLMILVPLCSCIYLAVGSVRYSAGRSRMVGVMNLNGNTAKNTYSLPLKKQFDLFAMEDEGAPGREKLENQFREMSGPGELVTMELREYQVHYPDSSCLTRPEVLQEKIKDYMKGKTAILFAKDMKPLRRGSQTGSLSSALPTPISGNATVSPGEGELPEKPENLIHMEERSISSMISPTILTKINAMGSAGEALSGVSESYETLSRQGKTLSSSISQVLKNSGKNVELAEYLTHMFSCYTTDATQKTLKGRDMSSRRMYRGEWEYLLYGHDSKRANVIAAATEILAIRTFLNSLKSTTSPETEAVAAADPVAGGVVAVAQIVAESLEDLRTLLSGGTVEANPTGENIRMSYQDYLRAFLLLRTSTGQSSNAILLRAAKLMQISCSEEFPTFDITKCRSQVKISAAVTILGHPLRREEVYSV